MEIKLNKEEKGLLGIKTRNHLDSSKQPKNGWRTIPFNGYYEAHPSGLIRNKYSKKLIKGTQTRKYNKFTSQEIVYLLVPKKTTYSRAKIIASTFPEKISQSKGDLSNGYVCFKDGDRTNCNVKNLFIGKGKLRNAVYKVNNSFMTNKDIVNFVNSLTNDSIGNSFKHILDKTECIRESKDYTIIKKGKRISILKSDSSLFSFVVERKPIERGRV